MKKMFVKISQNSLKKTCGRVSFLIKLLRPATLSKKGTDLGGFLCILRNVKELFLYRALLGDYFYKLLYTNIVNVNIL